MTRIVTFDLDSTLCDTEHRFSLINRTGSTDWRAYALACTNDALVEGVARMVDVAKQAGLEVHYVTGRHEDARWQTVDWLTKHLHEGLTVPERLHMDDSVGGDHVKAFGTHHAYKAHTILELVKRLDAEIVFHVDDHPSVVAHLSKLGIPCICVRPPYEVRSLSTKNLNAANESLV